MQCDMGVVEVPPVNGAGTLPIVSRCWASYTPFFGDGQSLACTAADTCKRSLTDSSLVMCGACPRQDPPDPLTFHFGCDTIIKSCTCGPPRLAPAFCYSTCECEAPAQACAFVDSELEVLDARTLCEACATRPLCVVPRGASAGQCACGLQELPFARCRAADVGNLIALPYSKICILQTDARAGASVSFSAEFAAAAATPCMAVDASTSYCMSLRDLAGGFYIVSTRTTQSRRLLLATGSDDDARLNASLTRCPTCQDALDAGDSRVRRQCVARYVLSAETVRQLGLHADVPRCAFCSAEDLWHVLAADPMLVPFLLAHPRMLGLVLMRHTPLARALHVAERLRASAQDLADVLLHARLADYIGVNTSASGVLLSSRDTRVLSHHLVQLLQALLRWHGAGNASLALGVRLQWRAPAPAPAAAAPARALISIADLARDVEFEVQRAFATQATYTQQISSAFDYNFPLASCPGRTSGSSSGRRRSTPCPCASGAAPPRAPRPRARRRRAPAASRTQRAGAARRGRAPWCARPRSAAAPGAARGGRRGRTRARRRACPAASPCSSRRTPWRAPRTAARCSAAPRAAAAWPRGPRAASRGCPSASPPRCA